MLQDAIEKSEQHVHDHTMYQDSYQTATDWLRLMQDRLAMCAEAAGDKHTIANKRDRTMVSHHNHFVFKL